MMGLPSSSFRPIPIVKGPVSCVLMYFVVSSISGSLSRSL